MSRIMMDARYMTEKSPIEVSADALADVPCVRYKPMDALGARHLLGVEGQALAEVAPDAVEVDGLGNCYVDPDRLIPILLSAIQDLTARVKKLERRRTTKPAE